MAKFAPLVPCWTHGCGAKVEPRYRAGGNAAGFRHEAERNCYLSATSGASRTRKTNRFAGLLSGRYWARTSDLRLVETALSQLS